MSVWETMTALRQAPNAALRPAQGHDALHQLVFAPQHPPQIRFVGTSVPKLSHALETRSAALQGAVAVMLATNQYGARDSSNDALIPQFTLLASFHALRFHCNRTNVRNSCLK